MSTDDDTTVQTKVCRKCGEVRPVYDFHRRPGSPDGRRAVCRPCGNAVSASWRAANKERNAEIKAAWYVDHKDHVRAKGIAYRAENGDQCRARCAAYYRANRDAIIASAASWAAANPARRREIRRAWVAANPESSGDNARIRRARKAAAPVVERIYRAKVWERDGGRCHICGKKADPNNWHLEHIVPLADGGEHSYRNVAVSHPACNLRKGVRGPGQLRLPA